MLVVLRLLRLDGPLRGWDIPLACAAVVIGLMMSTGPWAWAMAGSVGVLLAGLVRLPRWQLAAAGFVLCVVSGIGFGLSLHEDRIALEQVQARAGDPMRAQLGESRAARVLPALLTAVQQDDADPVCRLLTPQAESQLLAALRAGSCPDAVAELHRRTSGAPGQNERSLPQPQTSPDGVVVDACSTTWSSAAGPELGRILIMQTEPSVQRFAVRGFAPCVG